MLQKTWPDFYAADAPPQLTLLPVGYVFTVEFHAVETYDARTAMQGGLDFAGAALAFDADAQ